MSTSVLPVRSNRAPSTFKSTSNYVTVSGYPANPHTPYVVVSPVLVPCVETSVRSGKSRSKKGKKQVASAKVRYVPALTYTTATPQCLYYNRQYNAPYVKGVQPTMSQHFVSPYPMPINPEASRLSQGYVSALSAPAPAYTAISYNINAAQSSLNPLSRPYTPPIRKQSDAVNLPPQHMETLGERLSRRQAGNLRSGCSSPGTWSDLSSELTSRSSTPVGTVCPYCRGGKQSNNSDADSGVGGESDDEGSWCMCDSSSSTTDHSYPEKEDPFDFNLRYNKDDANKLSESTLNLIEFLCFHLNSHEWRTVARELGVDDVIIQSADYDEFESPKEQRKYIFCLWANSVSSLTQKEKCLQVENALREIGRFDVVDKITSLE